MPQYKSYAKLNLALGVTGLLDNGYHAVDMVMQQISLHDILTIEKAGELRVECGGVCDEAHNTAYRAAQLFFDFSGIFAGAHIRIEKRIPARAGLGGGSGNGATTLLALNELYGTRIPGETLKSLAFEIGMDVPFFIEGGCMRAQGQGEVLSSLVNRCAFEYLLVRPAGGIDTKRAYRAYDASPAPPVDTEAVAAALAAGDSQAYFRHAANALYPAAASINPEISRIVDACYAQRAAFAMMTGSGSCVFALFANKKALESAHRYFSSRYPFVATAQNIARGSYYSPLKT